MTILPHIKRCPQCNTEYPSTNFHADRRTKDGLRATCKNCSKKWRDAKHSEQVATRLKRREKRVLSGLCTECGLQRKEAGRSLCASCSQNRAASSRNRRTTFKQMGRCVDCGAAPLPTTQTCYKCWLKDISRRNLGTRKHWRVLGYMLEESRFICPYTGDTLIPGVNASLDHILPVHRYPEKRGDIENVEWVSLQVNEMKRDRTPEEFISLLSKILAYYTPVNGNVAPLPTPQGEGKRKRRSEATRL